MRRRRRRKTLIVWLGLVSLAATACAATNPTTTASANRSGPSYVYVAIGENGSGGFRNPSDLRSSWPQMFYASGLGTDATFYDFSTPGETVADALSRLLPQAEAVRPDLVTVWVSTADLVSGTNPAVYGDELGQLVRALRRHGATVLLANAVPPQIDSAFDSCQRRLSRCRPPEPATAAPSALAATVSDYNGIIAQTGRQTGAIVVDVHSVLADALDRYGVTGVLSNDQTSLSAKGSTLVARAFLAGLPKRFKMAPRAAKTTDFRVTCASASPAEYELPAGNAYGPCDPLDSEDGRAGAPTSVDMNTRRVSSAPIGRPINCSEK